MIDAHAQALRALIDAAFTALPTPPALYVGAVPGTPTTPYAVLWPPTGDRDRHTLVPVSARWSGIFRLTGVGRTTREAAWVLDKAIAAVVDQRPVIPGRWADPVQVSEASGLQPDHDVTPPVIYGVVSLLLVTHAT